MLNSRVKDIIYGWYRTFCVTSHCVTVIDCDLLGNCFAFIFASLSVIMMTKIFHLVVFPLCVFFLLYFFGFCENMKKRKKKKDTKNKLKKSSIMFDSLW